MNKRKTTKIKARLNDAGQKHPNLSRWTIPATAEAYDAMLVQIARAMSAYSWPSGKAYWMNDAEKALAAIGITRPKDSR